MFCFLPLYAVSIFRFRSSAAPAGFPKSSSSRASSDSCCSSSASLSIHPRMRKCPIRIEYPARSQPRDCPALIICRYFAEQYGNNQQAHKENAEKYPQRRHTPTARGSTQTRPTKPTINSAPGQHQPYRQPGTRSPPDASDQAQCLQTQQQQIRALIQQSLAMFKTLARFPSRLSFFFS